MPKNISYRPVLIDELITNERLGSYKAIFEHSNDYELVGAYLWNTHVCSMITPLLSVAEITLRNSVDNALAKELGKFWWAGKKLHYKSFNTSPHPIPYAVKALRNNFSKASDQVRRDKKERYNQHRIRPSHHETIAKTEFSTWEFILDHEFMGPNLIWPKCLGAVLRGPWPSSKAKLALSTTKDLVKSVREFRNRVSHYEPVWKRFGVRTEADVITHLHEKLDKVIVLIHLLSPEKAELVLKSGMLDQARRACSIHELRHWQHKGETHNVKSISKLSQVAHKAISGNQREKVVTFKSGKKMFMIQPI